jgi:hypothetical protein
MKYYQFNLSSTTNPRMLFGTPLPSGRMKTKGKLDGYSNWENYIIKFKLELTF